MRSYPAPADMTPDQRLREVAAILADAILVARFRSLRTVARLLFLLASLKNFLANDFDRAHALKRGGGRTIVSLDEKGAESRYQLEPSHALTAERHFERQWAMTLLDQVLDALRDEYHLGGKGALFEELKAVLIGQPTAYVDMAARLRRSEGAIKVAVHRLRRRYRELMRARIAETVGPDEGDVEDELRHLLVMLGSS